MSPSKICSKLHIVFLQAPFSIGWHVHWLLYLDYRSWLCESHTHTQEEEQIQTATLNVMTRFSQSAIPNNRYWRQDCQVADRKANLQTHNTYTHTHLIDSLETTQCVTATYSIFSGIQRDKNDSEQSHLHTIGAPTASSLSTIALVRYVESCWRCTDCPVCLHVNVRMRASLCLCVCVCHRDAGDQFPCLGVLQ